MPLKLDSELEKLFAELSQKPLKTSLISEKILEILNQNPDLKKTYPHPDKVATIDLMGVYGKNIKKILGNNLEWRTDLGGQITFETGLAEGLSISKVSDHRNYRIEIFSQIAPFDQHKDYPYKDIFKDYFSQKEEEISLNVHHLNLKPIFPIKIHRLEFEPNQRQHFDKQEVRNGQNLFYKFLPKIAQKIVAKWLKQSDIPFVIRLPYAFGGYLGQFLKVELAKQGVRQDLMIFVGQSHSLGLPKAIHQIEEKFRLYPNLDEQKTKNLIDEIITNPKTLFAARLASERLLETIIVSSAHEKTEQISGFYSWQSDFLPKIQEVIIQAPGIQNHLFYPRPLIQNEVVPDLKANNLGLSNSQSSKTFEFNSHSHLKTSDESEFNTQNLNPDIEKIIPEIQRYLDSCLRQFSNPNKSVLYSMGRFDNQPNMDRKGWFELLQAFCSQEYLRSNFNLILFQEIFDEQKFASEHGGKLTLDGKIRKFYNQNEAKLKGKVIFLGQPDQVKMAATAQIMGQINSQKSQNCFIYVGCSLWEPWGLTALENASCGVAIVLSKKYNAHKIFVKNESIYLFDPKKPAQISEAVEKTYNDKNLILKQKQIVEKYSWLGNYNSQNLAQNFIQKPIAINRKITKNPIKIYFTANKKTDLEKVTNLVKCYFYWHFRKQIWGSNDFSKTYSKWLREAKKLKINDPTFLQNPSSESSSKIYQNSELINTLKKQKPILLNQKEFYLSLFLDKDNTAIKKINGQSDQQASQKLADFSKQKNIPIWVISGAGIEDVRQDFKDNPLKIVAASCNVGITNYVFKPNGKIIEDKIYANQIQNFDKLKLISKVQPLLGKYQIYNLRFQNHDHAKSMEWPFDFMANLLFDIPLETKQTEQILQAIQKDFGEIISDLKFKVETNLCEEFGNNSKKNRPTNRYCLDLVSRNKASCIYREAEISKQFLPDKNIFRIAAGDSGNDLSLATCELADMFIIVGKSFNPKPSYLQKELQKNYTLQPKYKNLYTMIPKNLPETKEKFLFIEDQKSQRIGPESIVVALDQFFEYILILQK
jgi:glycosyltransferase involved in cell wall biosynthesis